jgi:hypothetical protein
MSPETMNVLRSSCKLTDIFKFGISRHILTDIPNIKLHRNPSSGSGADTCGKTDGRTDRHTDGHDEGNRRFSWLC